MRATLEKKDSGPLVNKKFGKIRLILFPDNI